MVGRHFPHPTQVSRQIDWVEDVNLNQKMIFIVAKTELSKENYYKKVYNTNGHERHISEE